MLGPVVLGLSLLARDLRTDPTGVSTKKSRPDWQELVPWFITGFLAVLIVRRTADRAGVGLDRTSPAFLAFTYPTINREPQYVVTEWHAEPTSLRPRGINRARWVVREHVELIGMTSIIIAGTIGMIIGLNIGFFAYAILEIGKS
jgi:hypothetical protein